MDERDFKFITSGLCDFTNSENYIVEKISWNESVKKKANELFERFSYSNRYNEQKDGYFYNIYAAKESALICIDEIIKALEHTDDCVINIIEIPEFDCASAFYEDVKKEIEKL